MDIEYLSFLIDNQTYKNNLDQRFKLTGITLVKIEELELIYNNGISFPKALKELLFLGGDTSSLLNRIWYKTQQEAQTAAREWLSQYNTNINKSFFVIETFNVGESFSFVYLNEEENPTVYRTYIPSNSSTIMIKDLDIKLDTYIKLLIIDELKNNKTLVSI